MNRSKHRPKYGCGGCAVYFVFSTFLIFQVLKEEEEEELKKMKKMYDGNRTRTEIGLKKRTKTHLK